VSGAIHHAWSVGHAIKVLQKLVHVLAGKNEDDDHYEAKD
jgi:hypothetical protein